MRKGLIYVVVIFLTGCIALTTERINVIPTPTIAPHKISTSGSYQIIGNDNTKVPYIAIINKDQDDARKIYARQNIRVIIERLLIEQFTSLGFTHITESPNSIIIDLQEFLAQIENSAMSHQIEATLIVSITAKTQNGQLVKTYTTNANRSGFLSASTKEVENILKEMLTLTLKEVATDNELNDYIKTNF